MRVKVSRLLIALACVAFTVAPGVTPWMSASASTVPTSATTLGTGAATDPLDIATSTTSNAKAIIWANGSYAAPEFKTAFSRDGTNWVTSSVPTVSGETQFLTDEYSARVAYSPSGVIMILWITTKTSGAFVLHSATSTDGISWSAPLTLDTNPTYQFYRARLVASPRTGNFTAIWLSWNANPYYAVRTSTTTDSSGSAWRTSQDIQTPGSSPFYTMLGVDAAGNLTAAWGVQVAGPPEQDFLVAARSTDGVTWTTPSTVSNIQPWRGRGERSMAVSPAGVVVITQMWAPTAAGMNFQIETTWFDGTWHTQYITPTGMASNYAQNPRVSVGANGTFAVAYLKSNNTLYTAAVKTSTDGATWSSEELPFGTTTYNSIVNSLAVSSLGQVFVSVSSFDATGLGQVRSLMPGSSWVTEFTNSQTSTTVSFGLNQTTSDLSVFTRHLSGKILKVQSLYTTNAVGALSSSVNKIAVAVGGSVSTTMTTTNLTTPVSFSVSPSLPNGLALNAATGAITGAPTAPQTPTDYTVTGTPAAGSAASTVISISVTPAAPQSLVATPSSGQISVAFTPGATGSGTISNYKYSIDNGATWVTRSPSSTASPLVISGLTNGTAYSVKLQAVTTLGDSAISAPVTATPTPTPTVSSSTVGDGAVSIAFTAPTSPPATITNYQYSLDGGTTWITRSTGTTASPLSITGLTNGTTYSITLRSVMTNTYGSPSAPLTITPATIPGSPTISSGTPSDGTVTLSWGAPSSNGGSAVTGYTVQQATTESGSYSAVSAGTCLTVAPTSSSLSCTVTGLTNGTNLFFRIAAKNLMGTGSYSTALASTAQSVPGSPTLSTLTAANGTLSAAFTAGSTGGGTISSYEYSLDGGSTWLQTSPATTASPMLITGLTNGTSYSVKIRALNAAGGGAASTASLSATPITAALAPLSPAGSPENQGTTLYWSAPANPAGAPITGYRVQIATSLTGVYLNVGAGTCATSAPTSTATTCTITGLTNGSSYFFKVTALNAAGEGAYSVATPSIAPRTTPSAPTISSLTAANQSITVTFSPGSDGGSVVTGYEYSLDNGTNWAGTTATSASPTFTLTGLTNGHAYTPVVRAVNVAGGGSPSTSLLTATPITVADSPTDPAGSAGNQHVTLYWSAPANPAGAAITGYRVQYATSVSGSYSDVASGTCATTAPTSSSSSCSVTGLTNGSSYYFKVTALNAAGLSSYSVASSAVIPRTTPDALIITSLTAGNRSFEAHFTVGFNGGNPISGFEYSLDGGLHWANAGVTGSATSVTITGLTNGNLHNVTLRALNDVGAGTTSNMVSAIPVTVPDAPTGFVVTYGDASATISFVEGDSGGSPITSLEYTLDGGLTWIRRIAATTSEPLVLTNLVNGHTFHVHVRGSSVQGAGLQSLEVLLNVPLPRVEMESTELTPGESTVVVGSGFAPSSQIRIVMQSVPIDLGIVSSDPSGSFTTHVSMPAGVQLGGHHLVFIYVATANAADTVPFTLSAPSAITAEPSLANTGAQIDELQWQFVAGFTPLVLGLLLLALHRRRRSNLPST